MVKNQHYIPVFYLKNFSKLDEGRDSKLYGYNLKTKEVFLTTIDDICSNKYFYEAISTRKANIVENNINIYFESWLPSIIIQIIQNNKFITKQFIQSIYILFAHFIIRSRKCVNELPKLLSIDKDTYLLGAVAFSETSFINNYVADLMNNHKYCYCIISKSKSFVINNSIPIVSYIELDTNVYSNEYIAKLSKYSDIFLPINNNMCLVLTNQYSGDNFYVTTTNDNYIDLINSSFINDSTCQFVYSQNNIADYIWSLYKEKNSK